MDLKELVKEIKRKKELEFIEKLQQKFKEATVFLVGGAVRDILIQNNPKKFYVEDLDFVVEGINKKDLEDFLNTLGKVKDVESRAFGVFIFAPKNRDKKTNLDISVPRSDKWKGEGYKDIEVETEGLKLKDDLSRRDFTVNALAINLRDSTLVDEFGGIKDLKVKLLRAVGKPEKRFQEDPSRILRGVRFVIQLGFKIEPKTHAAMKKMVPEVVKPLEGEKGKYRVAEEVIAKEFLKPFYKNPAETIKLYDKIELLKILLPEVEAMKKVKQPEKFHSEGDVYKHTLIALEKLKQEGQEDIPGLKKGESSINCKLGLFFHDIGKPATYTPPKTKDDRIRFNEHDDEGARIASKIIRRLKLTSMPKGDKLHVDKSIVVWLVKKHMILVNARPEEMKISTFEKYFFREDGASEDLLRLAYADVSATIPPDRHPDYRAYDAFVDKIEEIKTIVHAKKEERKLPPPLLDGNEVMKALNIESGPEVGTILKKLRELQLEGALKSKKEALEKIDEVRSGKL